MSTPRGTRTMRSSRDASPDYSRGFPRRLAGCALTAREAVSRVPRRPARQASQVGAGGSSRASRARRSSTVAAARRSAAVTPRRACVPAALPSRALGLDLAPALGRQPRDDHAPVGLRADPLDVPALGEVVEHLGDRRRCQQGCCGELARRQPAALLELDQKLELGVAELRASEVGVAAAQPVECAKDAAEGQPPSSAIARSSRAEGFGDRRRWRPSPPPTPRAARRRPRPRRPRGSGARGSAPRAAARCRGSAPAPRSPTTTGRRCRTPRRGASSECDRPSARCSTTASTAMPIAPPRRWSTFS